MRSFQPVLGLFMGLQLKQELTRGHLCKASNPSSTGSQFRGAAILVSPKLPNSSPYLKPVEDWNNKSTYHSSIHLSPFTLSHVFYVNISICMKCVEASHCIHLSSFTLSHAHYENDTLSQKAQTQLSKEWEFFKQRPHKNGALHTL